MSVFEDKSEQTDQKKDFKLEKLFISGVCVKPHIGYPGMKKKLQEKDLDLKPSDVPAIFSLGSKRLIPKKEIEKFAQLEREARGIVDTHSYEFYIPGIKFVPKTALAGVLEKLEDVKKKFNEARDAFVEAYPSLREQMLEKYSKYLDALAPHYPPVHLLSKKFKFDINVFEVRMPKHLTVGEVDLEEAQAEAEAFQKIQQNLEIEAKKKVDEFLTSTIEGSRAAIVEAFEKLKDKLADGKVHGRTVGKINKMIDTLSQMNFVGDDICGKLADFKKEFLTSKDKLTDKQFHKKVQGQIEGILNHAKTTTDVGQLVQDFKKRSILT